MATTEAVGNLSRQLVEDAAVGGARDVSWSRDCRHQVALV